VRAHQRSLDEVTALREVIQADCQPVRADGGMVDRRRLNDGERGDAASGVRLDFRCQCIDTSGFEPERRPSAEVATAGDLELGEKVAELCIAELVLCEVRGDPREEGVDTDPGDELLEHRSTLGVGDAVEVHLHGFEVFDGRDDGMRRR
jgi:hypothetical protein